MVSEIIMIILLIVIKLLLFKSMISKNIKKSSEFLLITPDYLKLKDSRQQNIKKTTTTLLSPKSLKISSSSNLQINQRTKIIQCLNKNRKSKAIQKVKSISPRNKDNSEINIQKVKRVESNSKTKNKNKKQQQIKQSFDKWKIEFFDSVNKKARIKSYYKQLNGSKTFEDDEYQKKQDKYKISSIEQNTMCTQLNKNLKNLYNRSKNILSIYKEKLKQTKKLNKTLMMQNNQLKNRLNKYQKF